MSVNDCDMPNVRSCDLQTRKLHNKIVPLDGITTYHHGGSISWAIDANDLKVTAVPGNGETTLCTGSANLKNGGTVTTTYRSSSEEARFGVSSGSEGRTRIIAIPFSSENFVKGTVTQTALTSSWRQVQRITLPSSGKWLIISNFLIHSGSNGGFCKQ